MVELTNENSLLQEIKNLSESGKIRDSVALTAQTNGSKLPARDAETKIQKLIPTTQQRLSAAKFYLDAMKNMNYVPYLGSQSYFSEEQGSLIDFSDSNLYVQVNLLNPGPFPMIVFLILQGFFSTLISSDDCVTKIINIAYDLLQDDRSGSKIRQELENRAPNVPLIAHLRIFYAIDQNRKPDKKGSPFNIAREIRNELVHGDIKEVVIFPELTLLGFSPDTNLYFNNLFFPENTPPKHNDTEMIAFCQNAYDETVNFVDECYKLIHADLQRCGVLPI